MIGARDVAFPRLNAFSYWLLLFGGVLTYFSFLAGIGTTAGPSTWSPLERLPRLAQALKAFLPWSALILFQPMQMYDMING